MFPYFPFVFQYWFFVWFPCGWIILYDLSSFKFVEVWWFMAQGVVYTNLCPWGHTQEYVLCCYWVEWSVNLHWILYINLVSICWIDGVWSFFSLVLSLRWVLKSPSVIVDFLSCSFSSISFCLKYFSVLSFCKHMFRIAVCSPLQYVMPLSVSSKFIFSEINFIRY